MKCKLKNTTTLTSTTSTSKKIDGWVRSTPIGVVIGILVVAVLVLSLISFFCFRRYCCLRRRRSNNKKTQVDDFDNSINFVTDGLITNLERTRNLQKNNKPYSDTVAASNLAHNHDSSTFMDVELADDP